MTARKNVNNQYDQSLQSFDIDTGGSSLTRTVWLGGPGGCVLAAGGGLFCAIRSTGAAVVWCDGDESDPCTSDGRRASDRPRSSAIAKAFMRDKLYQHESDKPLALNCRRQTWCRWRSFASREKCDPPAPRYGEMKKLGANLILTPGVA